MRRASSTRKKRWPLRQKWSRVPLARMESVRYYGGFPMSAHHVIAGVKAKLEKAA